MSCQKYNHHYCSLQVLECVLTLLRHNVILPLVTLDYFYKLCETAAALLSFVS